MGNGKLNIVTERQVSIDKGLSLWLRRNNLVVYMCIARGPEAVILVNQKLVAWRTKGLINRLLKRDCVIKLGLLGIPDEADEGRYILVHNIGHWSLWIV